MAKVLYVASIEDHILAFHLPFMEALMSQGHEVHVATRLKPGERKGMSGIVWHDIHFARSPFSTENVTAYLNLLRLMRLEEYDLVHVHTPVAAFIGRLAASRVGTAKVIYTAHGFHFFRGAPMAYWLLFFPLEKLARRWTDVILVMNEEDFGLAQRLGYVLDHSLFKVMGVGVDLERYGNSAHEGVCGLDVDSDAIVYTCVAELIPRKNLRFLLGAWERVASKVPHGQLLLVGEGPEREALEKMISTLNLPRVRLLGFRRDVPEILHRTDVFILVSRQEGLPRGVLEAMAAGKPVVVSRIRGHVDLVEDGKNGFLVDTDILDGLAEAMTTLAKSPELRQSMGQVSRQKAAAYSISNVVAKVGEIYQRFLQKNN